MIQTYWVTTTHTTPGKSLTIETSEAESDLSLDDLDEGAARTQRLIDWNVEKLAEGLRLVVSSRRDAKQIIGLSKEARDEHSVESSVNRRENGVIPLDEVQEIFFLPAFDNQAPYSHNHTSNHAVELSVKVINQLRDLVSCIASLYRDNPFHNFDVSASSLVTVVWFFLTPLTCFTLSPSRDNLDDDNDNSTPVMWSCRSTS